MALPLPTKAKRQLLCKSPLNLVVSSVSSGGLIRSWYKNYTTIDLVMIYVVWYVHVYCTCMAITYSKIMDQAGKAEGCQSCSWSAEQGKHFFPCLRSRVRNLFRETGSAVPSRISLLILHTQTEAGAYHLQDSSRFPRRRPFISLKPPYVIGSVPNSSGHAIAYRWRSLSRVRRTGPLNLKVVPNGCCLGR